MNALEPDPLKRAHVEALLGAMRAGASFKAAYEALLLELDDERADRVMQLQREARGAWLLLLRGRPRRGARALLIGNALSGASVPLSTHGFAVTLLDRSAERLRLALARNADLSRERTNAVLAGDGARLPFADGSFDLVVQEDGLPLPENGWRHDLAELRRVCAGELVVVADNRFAYKRSSGRRGEFDLQTPLEFVSRLVAPPPHELSLAGYRKLVAAPDFAAARAFALYPHAREFTFVVGLDGALPRLEVGPKERENKLKLVGHKLGLFPGLAPSFALISARNRLAGVAPRIERVLAELARLLDTPVPLVEHLVATRGNSALVLTQSDDVRARWCIHVPLSAAQRSQLRTHFEISTAIVARFPDVPVPRPLFLGEIEGVFLTCEQRLGGLTAPQLTGDARAGARMFLDSARHLAGLVSEPARALDEREFESLIGARFDLVARFAGVPATLANLARMRDDARRELVGCVFPRVVYHADLRSKHVQVERDGRVLGLLDWGSGEIAGLPYFDLLHFVAHERKQVHGLTAAEAWRIVRERALLDHERAALDDYARRVGLDDGYRRAIERIYPVLVAAMAESHWDYSRPRWLHRQFGV